MSRDTPHPLTINNTGFTEVCSYLLSPHRREVYARYARMFGEDNAAVVAHAEKLGVLVGKVTCSNLKQAEVILGSVLAGWAYQESGIWINVDPKIVKPDQIRPTEDYLNALRGDEELEQLLGCACNALLNQEAPSTETLMGAGVTRLFYADMLTAA